MVNKPGKWYPYSSRIQINPLKEIMINALLRFKYKQDSLDIFTDVDHAQLFIVSCLLTKLSTAGNDTVDTEGFSTTSILLSCDI